MRLLLAALMILCALPAAGQSVRPGAVADEAVTFVIRPSVTNFQREADGLQQAMTGLCAGPSERSLALARDRFATTLLAYGRIESFALGPATEENRAARLLASVGAIVPEAQMLDAGVSGPEALAAVAPEQQGLGTLEAILFARESATLMGPVGAGRCSYGLAIAQVVATAAEELLGGWYSPRGVAIRLMAPRPEYADYRSDADTIAALADVLAGGIELVRQRAAGMTDGREGQFSASGLTRAMVRANLVGLEMLYKLSGIGRAASDGETAHARIAASFAALLAAIDIGSAEALAEFAVVSAALEQDLAGLPAIIAADG